MKGCERESECDEYLTGGSVVIFFFVFWEEEREERRKERLVFLWALSCRAKYQVVASNRRMMGRWSESACKARSRDGVQ